MPLTVNVGLSRKCSRNYQSAGKSINIIAELDGSLIRKPKSLQRRIQQLFQEAAEALDQQSIDPLSAHSRRQNEDQSHPADNGSNGRSITSSQKRAISAISRRMGLDPEIECRKTFGHELDSLTVPEASKMIDCLKDLGNGVKTEQNGES